MVCGFCSRTTRVLYAGKNSWTSPGTNQRSNWARAWEWPRFEKRKVASTESNTPFLRRRRHLHSLCLNLFPFEAGISSASLKNMGLSKFASVGAMSGWSTQTAGERPFPFTEVRTFRGVYWEKFLEMWVSRLKSLNGWECLRNDSELKGGISY